MALVQSNPQEAEKGTQKKTNDELGGILREYVSYLDALPYIDKEYEQPDMQSNVHTLIEEEMRSFAPKNYLAHLPEPPSLDFPQSVFLKHEFNRIANNKPLTHIDSTRYSVDPPPKELEKDVQAWKTAINNAHAQMEYQNSKQLNMEMLENFGSQTWLVHNQQIEDMKAALEIQVKSRRKEADIINMKRKSAQETLMPQLIRTSQKRDELVNSNLQITKALETSRIEVKRMRIQTQRAGVPNEEIENIATQASNSFNRNKEDAVSMES